MPYPPDSDSDSNEAGGGGADASLGPAHPASGTDPATLAATPFDKSLLYAAIIDSAIDYAIVAADIEGRIIEWNSGAEAVFGWPAEAILGHNISMIFTPEDREAGVPQAEMRTALASGHALDERWHMRRDGSRFWADGRMMALVGRSSAASGYLKVVRDQTATKISATQAVSATALKVITDHVDTAILQVDTGGAVVFANPAAVRLFGRTAMDLKGRPIDGMLTPEFATDGFGAKVAARDETFIDRPMLIVTPGGATVYATASQTPIVVGDAHTGAVLTLQDTSRRRKVDEAMRAELRRHEALQQTQRAIEAAWTDPDVVYRIVVDGVVAIVPQADCASIELIEGDSTVNQVTTDASLGEVGMRVPLAGSLAGAALAHGQAVVCRDTETDDRIDRHRSRRYGVRSMVVVPIAHAGRPVGVLKVSARRPDAFATRDLLVAHVLVGHIATAYARSDEATALERLQRSEERLQLALQASDTIGIWDWDVPGDRCFGDPRFARLLAVDAGAAAEGLPIAAFMTHVNPEDLVWIKAAARRAMVEGGDLALEFRVEVPGERLTWLSAHGRSFNDGLGNPLRFLGAVVDVTERKRTETSLRDAETNARLAVEAAGLGLWNYDPVHDRLQWDERCRSLFGHSREVDPSLEFVIGRVHPRSRERAQDVVRRALAAAGVNDRSYEFEIVRADDGLERWVEVSAQAFFVDGLVTRIIGTVSDITDQVRAREAQARFGENLERQVAMRTDELSQANARLVAEMTDRQRVEEALRQSQKMEAVGQLTGGIAHDFNNLLTGITGSLDLMRKRIEQGRTADVERYMTAAATSANRAAALTHRLLAFARRQPLDAKPVRLNALAASLEDLFRRTLGESIEITFDLAPDLWTTLCDPHQLENALLNLVINARDAMPDGGHLTIRTANTVVRPADIRDAPDRREGDFVLLKVRDTGVGMAPDVMARVFEPFFTTKPIGQGTGLGLSMIYGFARQSEGHVSVASQVGEGTAFTILLPRFGGAEDEPREAEPQPVSAVEGETVLVVEDDSVVRALVLDVLGELGYRTLDAHDGIAGLAILQGRSRVDLLVTDVGLPGLNGRQIAEMGRASRPGLKVLFITGYAENAVFGRGLDDPATQMITKPFAIDALAARIRSMLTAGTADGVNG